MSLLHFIEIGHVLEHEHQRREQQRAEAEHEILKRNMLLWERAAEGEELVPEEFDDEAEDQLQPALRDGETMQPALTAKPDRHGAVADLQHKLAKDTVGLTEK